MLIIYIIENGLNFGHAHTNGMVTRSSESDGRSMLLIVEIYVSFRLVLIALNGLDCPDWFIFP